MALVIQNFLNVDQSGPQHEQLYNRDGVTLDVNSLPAGFPIDLSTNMTWNSATLNSESYYTYILTNPQVLEIETALNVFKGMRFPMTCCQLI